MKDLEWALEIINREFRDFVLVGKTETGLIVITTGGNPVAVVPAIQEWLDDPKPIRET
jgi:hypothetical protein